MYTFSLKSIIAFLEHSGGGLATKLCPTLCDPMDCSPAGSSVHGISQARILEWAATSSLRGSSQPRDQILVSCITGGFFMDWVTRKHMLLLFFFFYNLLRQWIFYQNIISCLWCIFESTGFHLLIFCLGLSQSWGKWAIIFILIDLVWGGINQNELYCTTAKKLPKF